MSETISALPTIAGAPALADLVPITHGPSGPNTGVTYAYTIAKILAANGFIYAGDPAYNGGVKADNVTDDTTAWQQALAAAFNSSSWVIPPVGVSVVSGISIPSGVGIIARTPGSYSASVGYESTGCIIKGTSSSAPVITMATWSQLHNIQVTGNGSQPCIAIPSGYVELVNSTLFGGSVGVSFSLSGGSSRLLACRIHECATAAILNAFDTEIVSTYISGCGNGIQLANGSNGVRITGGKIEKCTGYGLIADGTGGSIRDLVVNGTVFDANNKANVLLRAVTGSSISGAILARGGQGQSGSAGGSDDCNLYVQNCTGVTINGIGSRTGLADGGGGYNSPYWALYDGGGNISCIVTANALAFHNNSAVGSTFGPINTTATFNLASTLNSSYWS